MARSLYGKHDVMVEGGGVKSKGCLKFSDDLLIVMAVRLYDAQVKGKDRMLPVTATEQTR